MLRQSRWRVPQCPDSGLPIYRDFTPGEVARLLSLATTGAWKERRATANPLYLTALTKQALNESSQSVADSLLQAIWTATDQNRAQNCAQNRAIILVDAIQAWTTLAAEPRPNDHGPVSDDAQNRRDRVWVIANWLRVDLTRQSGAFDRAATALDDFTTKAGTNHKPIPGIMIAHERMLILAHDSAPAAPPPPLHLARRPPANPIRPPPLPLVATLHCRPTSITPPVPR